MFAVMGFSLSWLAVKGKSPKAVRDALGFHATGKREEIPESDLSAAELPGGWYLIVSNRSEQVVPDSAMQRLSGSEVVTCFVEEHVMFSNAAGWQDGRKCWSITHDSQRGIRHLEAEGNLPPVFESIRDRLLSKQNEEEVRKPRRLLQPRVTDISEMACDYVFDVPVATAHSLTGYRHDQEMPALTGQPFEVLVSSEIEKSAPGHKLSFWKRLLAVLASRK